MDPLTEQQRAILDLERQFYRTSGAKDDAIRKLGLSPVRYYQLLNQLLDSEAALAYDPVTVKRLSRVRLAARPRDAARFSQGLR